MGRGKAGVRPRRNLDQAPIAGLTVRNAKAHCHVTHSTRLGMDTDRKQGQQESETGLYGQCRSYIVRVGEFGDACRKLRRIRDDDEPPHQAERDHVKRGGPEHEAGGDTARTADDRGYDRERRTSAAIGQQSGDHASYGSDADDGEPRESGSQVQTA
tara:strand:- start:281 stop:751 length:471 start_codon:yes stop_codon:yes gene_type:complete